MTITLSGEIESDMLKILTKSISDLSNGEKLTIYFSSRGGYVGVAEAMINIVNSHKDHIEMIFYGEILSAGMMIFLRTTCKRSLVKEVVGMYHFAWQSLDVSEGGNGSDEYSKFYLKWMKEQKSKTLEYIQTLPFTEKEIAEIRKGKDVYFSTERMDEILKAQTNANNEN